MQWCEVSSETWQYPELVVSWKLLCMKLNPPLNQGKADQCFPRSYVLGETLSVGEREYQIKLKTKPCPLVPTAPQSLITAFLGEMPCFKVWLCFFRFSLHVIERQGEIKGIQGWRKFEQKQNMWQDQGTVYSLLKVTALALSARICQEPQGVSFLKNFSKSLLSRDIRWI